jgi:alkylhydroperoxidase/carboxymuconolactone decarboxylase family protein YurZ
VKRRYPKAFAAYEAFGYELAAAGPLRDRDCELVRLGIAIGAGLDSAIKAHVRRGLDAGLNPDELRHAALLAGTTAGFPSMMKALMLVDDELPSRRP